MPFRPSTVRLEPLQPFGKVSDQVVGVFQADVEAHRGAFGLPFSRGAAGRRIDGEGKRFKPAPGKADAEQFQPVDQRGGRRSEEHTSELQSLMRISYAVFCLKKTTYPIHRI